MITTSRFLSTDRKILGQDEEAPSGLRRSCLSTPLPMKWVISSSLGALSTNTYHTRDPLAVGTATTNPPGRSSTFDTRFGMDSQIPLLHNPSFGEWTLLHRAPGFRHRHVGRYRLNSTPNSPNTEPPSNSLTVFRLIRDHNKMAQQGLKLKVWEVILPVVLDLSPTTLLRCEFGVPASLHRPIIPPPFSVIPHSGATSPTSFKSRVDWTATI